MNIKIDKTKCIGCGTCPALCEEVFEMGDDWKAKIKDGANLNAPCIKDAKDACPVEAIEIED